MQPHARRRVIREVANGGILAICLLGSCETSGGDFHSGSLEQGRCGKVRPAKLGPLQPLLAPSPPGGRLLLASLPLQLSLFLLPVLFPFEVLGKHEVNVTLCFGPCLV